MASKGKDEIVCNCMQVTRGQIEEAIDNGADTVEKVGEVTQAGTGCGGCVPEIEELLRLKGKL